MENTYLYVFSTIPQVIAAIIGFSSAFILLRINTYDSVLKSICDQIITKLDRNYGGLREYQLSMETRPLAAKLKELEKLNRQNNINGIQESLENLTENEYVDEREKFKTKYLERKAFIKKFKRLVLMGCVPLTFPLIELSLAVYLNSNFFLGISLLFLTIAITLIYLLIFISFLAKNIED